MAGIFISYRRDDSRHAAGRLGDDLADAFGRESIFRDIEGIEPGLDFTETLERALARCDVMLVLIGPRWIDIADEQGRRRLLQPGDWIRQELATALDRNIRVVPVLLEGAKMPAVEDLPEDLHRLPKRQWFELSDLRWRSDLQRLVEALAKVPGLRLHEPVPPAPPAPPAPPLPAPAAKSNRKAMFTGIGIGVLGVFALAVMLADEPEDEPHDLGGSAAPGYGDASPPAEPPFSPALAPPAGQLAPGAGTRPAQGSGPLPDLPDVAGRWQASTGELISVAQSGTELQVTLHQGGVPAGAGIGQVQGPLMHLVLDMYTYGTGGPNTQCELHQAPGGRQWVGMCQGPEGLFEAAMAR